MFNDKLGRDRAKEAYAKHQIDIKNTLDMQALKNYCYYTSDHLGILKFLNEALAKIVSDSQVRDKTPRIYINDIPKIIRRLSMVYKTTPERIYNKELSEDALDLVNATAKHYKEFHRQAKLLNTVLVRPILRDGYFDFLILGRQLADVIEQEDNFNKMEELNYYKRARNKDKEEVFIKVHWTNELYWLTDENNEVIKPRDYLGIEVVEDVNPYKVIPFVKLKLNGSNDFWGDGMSDVVNIAEQNNIKLCDTYYKLWMSFGYPLGTNLGITAEQFSISPYKPIMINNARVGDISPALEFVTPQHEVGQDTLTIDYLRKAAGTSKGLPVSGYVTEETRLSGYAKQIDNLELMENNEDDKETLRDFEYDLFEMMKLESKVNGGVSLESYYLEDINFEPYEFPKTTDEQNAEREFNYKYNIETPVDWVRDNFPTMTDEEILAMLKDNRKLKIELGERPNLFERLNNEIK